MRGSSINFEQILPISVYISPLWLLLSASNALRLLCIHVVSFLTKFHQDLSSSCRDIDRKPSKTRMKIGRFLGKIAPWRRQVGKNLMRRTGKRIYRRFWISNQIFDSIYGSRDMALSLDTTFGIFGQNRNFVDEYLENEKRFWHAVFARCSEMFQFTFWVSLSKIVRAIFEKKSKNHDFDHFFGLFGWSGLFFKNPAVSLFYGMCLLTSCKVSEKSLG